MKAIVLCPGPSLSQYTPQPAAVTIGVNRAVLFQKCDWLASSDYPFLRDYEFGYPVKLFTNQDTKLHRAQTRFTEVLHKEALFHKYPPAETSWTLLTATSALILAAHLGATQIDVYGADWKGTQDWDGHEYGANQKDYKDFIGNPAVWVGNEAWRTRGEKRWSDEAINWHRACAMLTGKGIEVTRHGPT